MLKLVEDAGEVALEGECADRLVAETPATSLEPVAEVDPGQPIDDWVGWSDQLEPRARVLCAEVRRRLAELWLPVAGTRFLAGAESRDLMRELGRLGALGAAAIGRDGAPPLAATACCALMHALEYADGGLRCGVTIQECVIQALLRFGDAAQKAHWLGPLSEGTAVASFALTEPEAGSDLRALATTGVRKGADWILTGRKSWVTHAPIADLLVVWARTGERHDAIRGFLVERGTAGLEIVPNAHAASMRAAMTGQIALTGVRVPGSALLPHAWGLADVNACLDFNRLTVAWGVMGAARFCLEAAIGHATSRRQFGTALASRQLVQAQLADMAAAVAQGEILSLHAARRLEERPLRALEVSLLKRTNCAAALEVARRARAVLGARGVDLDAHVVRHLLNLEASYSYGGTHEIHGLVIGRALTGIAAF